MCVCVCVCVWCVCVCVSVSESTHQVWRSYPRESTFFPPRQRQCHQSQYHQSHTHCCFQKHLQKDTAFNGDKNRRGRKGYDIGRPSPLMPWRCSERGTDFRFLPRQLVPLPLRSPQRHCTTLAVVSLVPPPPLCPVSGVGAAASKRRAEVAQPRPARMDIVLGSR